MLIRLIPAVLATAFLMFPATASANSVNEYKVMVAAIEAKSGIPQCVLQQIVQTESGFSPWEINRQGPDIHSKSQAEAAAKAVALFDLGWKIDVGIAQRNVFYHYTHEKKVHVPEEVMFQLMDPVANAQWAADYWLELLRGVHGDVNRAIGRYHRFVQDAEFYKYLAMAQANIERCRRAKGVDISGYTIPDHIEEHAPPTPEVKHQMAAIHYALTSKGANDERAAKWSAARRAGTIEEMVKGVDKDPEFQRLMKLADDPAQRKKANEEFERAMKNPAMQAGYEETKRRAAIEGAAGVAATLQRCPKTMCH
jgi:hypothetical protein